MFRAGLHHVFRCYRARSDCFLRRSLSPLTISTRNMASSAQINADRFLADRTAPLCGLEVAKSFAQLR